MLIFVAILNLRPGVLGQIYGEQYVFIVYTLILVYLIFYFKFYLTNFKKIFFIIFFLFYAYLFFQTILINRAELFSLLVIFLLNFSVILFLTLMKREYYFELVKYLILGAALLSISYVVTFTLYVIFDFNYQKLQWYKFIVIMKENESYYTLRLLFPFSLIYDGHSSIGNIYFPRAIGLFREPGIYQMVLIILFFITQEIKISFKKLILTLLFLNIVFTFSTAGIFSFFVAIAFKYIFFYKRKKNRLLSIVMASIITITAITLLFFTNYQISINNKLENRSGLERLGSILESFELIKQKPLFGVGFQNNSLFNFPVVNFIASTAQIGLVGVLIYLIPCFFLIYLMLKNKDPLLVCFIPLLFTTFISQPIYDKPIFWLMYFIILFAFQARNFNQNQFIGIYPSENERKRVFS